MPTNFEHYKEEILKLVEQQNDMPALLKGKLAPCSCEICSECDFNVNGECDCSRMRWLYAEHIEKPKLTKKERLFCELVETGWLAKDADGKLFWYAHKPEKSGCCWNNYLNKFDVLEIQKACELKFPFITWQDTEPWVVEYLLNLEVEE